MAALDPSSPRRGSSRPGAATSAWWSAPGEAAALDAARRLVAADCCDAEMTLAKARAIAYIALSCGCRSGCDGGSGRRPGAVRAGERPQRENPAWGDAMSEIVIASAARTPVGAF